MYDRLSGRLFNVPLLITPEKADTIAEVFNAHLVGKAAELPKYEPPSRIELASTMQMRRTEGGYYLSNQGIAVVQVFGSLLQRGDSLDALSGMTGYNRVAGQMSAALRDPSVRGMVLEFDSPGGEVAGVIELASLIADAEKPVWAHANELAASAAYWLAAAADRVYAPTTGLLGSIGVLMLHADRSKQNDRSGVVYTPIFAGARKLDGSSMAPLSEEARAWAQARVDQVYSLFVQHVAAHRGISEKKVRETEAGVFSVQEAATKKLADGVATLGDTVQMMTDDLNSGRSKRKSYGRAAAHAQSSQEKAMSEKDPGAAPKEPAAITQAQLDAAKAAGIAEGRAAAEAETKAKAEKEAKEKADTDAKERVKAILGCAEAKERPALAQHLALDTTMSADDAKGVLGKAAKETGGNRLDAAMRGKNPNLGADGGQRSDGGGAAKTPIATATNIYDMRAGGKA